MKSTINKLKETGIKQKPKETLHQVSQELDRSSSSSQQPKNYKQVRRRIQQKEDLYQ